MVAQPISFDFSQPAAQVLAVVFFVIPGLNVTWVTDRLEGRTSLSPSERLFRSVIWSVVVYAVMSPLLLRLQHEVADRRSIWPSQDLFLEHAWKLDEEGGFVEPARGNAGVLFGRDDIELVEFGEAHQEGNEDRGQANR